MAAQKRKKKLLAEMFCIFECLLTQNPPNQCSQLSLFSQTIGRLLHNPKTGGSGKLFLPENYFKTCS